METNALVPAAEYVRMSTEEQENSISIQQAAIRRYAEGHGYRVVMTYADPGKSGIEIKHRPGLRQLIHDVVDGQPLFRAVLVFDVSRWGRFQDIDESAHYEFLCRSAGIPVHYCAEQFENNASLSSDMMKALRRTMAAEYSRDLALRVKGGMRLLARRGFHLGGVAGYGLRRLLISANGSNKQILRPGELKSIKSDRIILMPGPKSETDVIRFIFFLASEKKKSPQRIAEVLTSRGIKNSNGRVWDKGNVRLILKNERYIGTNVWGKTTKPFNKDAHKLPRSEWIIRENALKPLVSREQFVRVQSLLSDRCTRNRKPDGFYLKEMRRILEREGTLSESLLKKQSIFDHRAYIRRFGSTLRAYQLVGFKPSPNTLKAQLGYRRYQRLRANLVNRLSELFPKQLKVVHRPHQAGRIALELDNNVQVAIHICRPTKMPRVFAPRWVLTRHHEEDNLLSLICLSNKEMTGFSKFYIVPPIGKIMRKYKVLRENHPILMTGKRLDSLTQFYDAAQEIAEKWRPQDSMIFSGDTVFDERTSHLRVGRRDIGLSPMEGLMFKKLIQRAGTPVLAPELAVLSSNPTEDFVRRTIAALRKKLGRKYRRRVVTVFNKGYMYKARLVHGCTVSW